MLERSFDADRINEVINHPAVRPFVGDVQLGDLDISLALAKPENWFIMGEYGGFGLIWSSPRTHEVHTFILPEGRGVWARKAAKVGIAFAAKNGDKALWTRIPPNQKNVAIYARMMGMRPTNEIIETLAKPYQVYSMELI